MRFMPFIAAGVVASVAFLSGCNGTAPTLTWQQQVAIVCSASTTELNTLSLAGVFTGGAQTTLTKQIQPDVAKVCAIGATVTTASLQNILNATLPAVQVIVDNSTLSAADKQKATLAIGGVGLAVNTAIAMMPAATATAASGAVAASAPAVAVPASAASGV